MGLGFWLLIIAASLLVVSVGYYTYKKYQKAKKKEQQEQQNERDNIEKKRADQDACCADNCNKLKALETKFETTVTGLRHEIQGLKTTQVQHSEALHQMQYGTLSSGVSNDSDSDTSKASQQTTPSPGHA